MSKLSRTALLAVLSLVWIVRPAFAEGNLKKVNHIIVLIQENHSFDNYFGALGYAPGSPYHNGNGRCLFTDSRCVDGLTCTRSAGKLTCSNSNVNNEGVLVFASHSNTRCITDPDHSWYGEHVDLNFDDPNDALKVTRNNGYERDDEPLNGDEVMNFYTQEDLPFYYKLASTFAISDRHFAGSVGPTFPNRSYLEAATSFGHLTTADAVPPPGGYAPITGTIYDLLNNQGVSWADYYQDVASDIFFDEIDPQHNLPLSTFYEQAAGNGTLPSVVFIDPNLGVLTNISENDEHPPTDIQRGQYISRSSLDYPLAQEVLAFLHEHIQYVHLMCDDRTYVTPACAMHTRAHFETQLTPEALAEAYETLSIADSPMDHMKEHAIAIDKVVVNLGDAALAQSMLPVVARQFGVETAVMEGNHFEITAGGVNKATGIEQVAQHAGFAMEETIAIGDSGNDILMLQSVGFPIAMGNASDEVKALARMVAPPVTESGAVRVLEELFFS